MHVKIDGSICETIGNIDIDAAFHWWILLCGELLYTVCCPPRRSIVSLCVSDIQMQFYATIYLFFETRDISGRLRKMEKDGYLSLRDSQSDEPSAVKGNDDE